MLHMVIMLLFGLVARPGSTILWERHPLQTPRNLLVSGGFVFVEKRLNVLYTYHGKNTVMILIFT